MIEAEVKALIQKELPHLLSQDPLVRDFVLRVVADYYASKPETESRFDRVLKELEGDRQEQAQKWDEQNRLNREILSRLDRESQEQAQKWDEQNRLNREILSRLDRESQEQAQKWDEQNRLNREILSRLDRESQEQAQKWDEQIRKWDEQNRQNQAVLQEIQAMNRKHESSIGALGSRWGIASETSFRNALQGILEESFGVQVLNLNLFDQEGEVFGRPDQVEIDLIIKNGLTIACEIKSSIDKAGMYSFARKADFYAKHENREINRKMVISPMVDRRALPVAAALGIEIYSYADTVENL
jgi:hypothetical protein